MENKKSSLSLKKEIIIEELTLDDFLDQLVVNDDFYENQVTAFAHSCCSTT